MDYRLEPFDDAQAAIVLSWARSPKEREAWAAIVDDDPDPSIVQRWHAEKGVHPFGLVLGDRLVSYGEIWEDAEEHETELARVIVDPAARGQGIGRAMVAKLAEHARELGYDNVGVRVVPTNMAALSAYRAAGFVRATAEEESRFNEGQPCEYVWMGLAPHGAPPGP